MATRLDAIGNLGATELAARTLLAAAEAGAWLPRGHELLLLLAHPAHGCSGGREAALAAGVPQEWLEELKPHEWHELET